MRARFNDPATRTKLTKEIDDMLAPRGGAGKLLVSDRRPDLNGRTLAQVAEQWKLSVAEAVFRILSEQDEAMVQNLDLYDVWNTKYLARQDWMMTGTDGYTPPDTLSISPPRSYGSLTRKLLYALQDTVVSLPFAVRGMTSLSAGFYGFPQRGQILEGFYADIAVFDPSRVRDIATYDRPHQYSEGTLHVLVNGKIAFRNGNPTGVLAGRPLPRERGHAVKN